MNKNTERAKKQPIVVIVGETASGKSGLGMSIARTYDGEIIAADSRTVYRGFDVASAKPSVADRQEIPHHLLDIVTPDQRFTAAQFKRHANNAIHDIHERDKLPIMVGGTGLYIDGVLFDFDFAPVATPAIRAELEKLTDQELIDKAQAMGAVGINTKNRRHVMRYIETGGTPKQELVLRENTIVVGLRRSKNVMRRRIEQRVEQMFRAGLRKEINQIIAEYGWDNEATSGMVSRLFRQYENGEISMSALKRQFVQKDIHYAKRQRTWFKRNPHIQWFENEADAEEAVAQFLVN